MTQEFKGTLNWRIRKVNNDFFFIEADLPNAVQNGHYPRLEVMQEDFGEHNGYTYELRMADGQLIAHAPEMLEMLKTVLSHYEDVINGDYSPFALRSDIDKAKQLIIKATTI